MQDKCSKKDGGRKYFLDMRFMKIPYSKILFPNM